MDIAFRLSRQSEQFRGFLLDDLLELVRSDNAPLFRTICRNATKDRSGHRLDVRVIDEEKIRCSAAEGECQ